MNNKILNILFPIGGITIILASFLKINDNELAKYVYSIGTLLLITYHATIAYKSKDSESRIQRSTRMSFVNSLFLAVGAYFMITNANSWILAVLIYALATLFLTFRTK
jgi:hypothetical protein